MCRLIDSTSRRWIDLAILLTAAFMRFWRLRDVPPGLAQDEVLNADIAESIWQGNVQLFFREGWGHEPLYHYFAALFQPLLGDNWLSIRLPSAVLGVLVVALMLRWARREFGPWTAWTAGLALAVAWWPIVFSRVGIRPILEPVWLLLSALMWRRPWLAGLLLGLAAYSYTPGVLMLSLPLLMAVASAAMRRPAERYGATRNWVIIFIAAVATYLPLAVTLLADPSLLERADQLRGPLDALREGDLGPLWQATWRTLGVFGLTGDPRWTYQMPHHPVFPWPVALLFVAGLAIAIRKYRHPRYAFLLLWLLVGLLPSMVTPDAPSTIRLIGALPPAFLLLGVPVQAWVDRRRAASAALHPITVGVVLSCAAFLGYDALAVHMNQWANTVETRLKYQTTMQAIAEEVDARGGTAVINDGFFAPIDADSLRRNAGREAEVRWVQAGNALVLPVGEAWLYVPESDPVHASLLAAGGISAEPLFRSGDSPGFAVHALDGDVTLPAVADRPTFGRWLSLIGLEYAPVGDSIELLTHWRVAAESPADDLAFFVHVVGDDGRIVSQHDGMDAIPAFLQPGDYIIQRHWLPRPAQATEAYRLRLGLYNRTTDQRLTYGATAADSWQLPDLVRFPVQ